MFEHFSFGPSLRQHQLPFRDDGLNKCRNDSVSPTASRSPSPSCPHRYAKPYRIHISVAELSQKLNAHNLQPRQRHQPSNASLPTPPSLSDETSFEHDSTPRSPSLPTVPSPRCRRRQRQIHSRLQCDPQHLKALAELVDGMVNTGNQCYVYQPPAVPTCDGASPSLSRLTSSTSSSSSSSSSDDGSTESNRGRRTHEPFTRSLAHKQSAEWSRSRTGISKTARQRKDISRRGSAAVGRLER